MTADPTFPPPMFDVSGDGEMTPPIFDRSAAGYGPALTPYGRHHGLQPGVFGGSCCDVALHAPVEFLGQTVWVHHVCSLTGLHLEHTCDRCDERWEAE